MDRDPDTAALPQTLGELRAAGLDTWVDAAGNIFGGPQSPERPPLSKMGRGWCPAPSETKEGPASRALPRIAVRSSYAATRTRSL